MSEVQQSAETDALDELAAVCDAYGLPHSAVALDRHLTGNAALTIETWKATADLLGHRLNAVRDLVLDLNADPDYLVPKRHLGDRLRAVLDSSSPPGVTP